MELSEHDWQRLERYLTREGTAEELAQLDRWVAGDPELRALAEAMGAAARAPGAHPDAWDTDAAWRKVSRRMPWYSRPPLAPPERRRVAWLPWALAASLAGVAASAMYLITPTEPAPREASAAREIATRRGERAAFTLSDGSRLILGAESRLTIPAAYGRPGHAREVRLDGQAHFVVRHDSLRPFRVVTPLGIAEDLGTEFVVSTYAETRGLRVVVAEGRVGLHQAGSADSLPLVTLSRGDLAQLDSLGTATVRRVDPAPYLEWTGGVLAFDATPLREVVPQLARWYDVEIRLADSSLGSRRLTVAFRNQSVSQALDLLALSLELQVQRSGRAVTLRSRR